MKALNTMSRAELAKALLRADSIGSTLADELIACGRGTETPTEIALKTDAQSIRYMEHCYHHAAIHAERQYRMTYHGSLNRIKSQFA